jgi:large subunit ribosomal protein L10
MAITRQKKEEILAELVKKFQEAKSVSFGQYAGMSVTEISDMRQEMREAGVEFKVAKKTLMRLAAKEMGLELPDEIVEGTVGVAFSFEDAVSGPKLIKKTSKDVEVVKLLGGIMEGKVLTITEMGELADLPSREELLAKFVGMMRSPLQSFYGAVSSPMSAFARTLSEYSKQLPAEEAKVEETPSKEKAAEAEEAKEETPAEEAPAEEKAEEPAPAEETPEAADEAADAEAEAPAE